MPHIVGRPNEGHSNDPKLADRWGYPFSSGPAQPGPFRSARDVLTSPNDLDLGMLEALGLPTTTTTTPPPTTTTPPPTTTAPTAGPSLAGPLGAAPTPGSSDPAWWRSLTNVPSSQIEVEEGGGLLGRIAGAGLGALEWVGDRYTDLSNYVEDKVGPVVDEFDDAFDRAGSAVGSVVGGVVGAGKNVINAIGEILEEPSVWTDERPTLLPAPAWSPNDLDYQNVQAFAEANMSDALAGDGTNANTFYDALVTGGMDDVAEDFRRQYEENAGITLEHADQINWMEGDSRFGDYYAQLDPAAQDRYQTFVTAAGGNYGADAQGTTQMRKDFQAVEAFIETLPSPEEAEAAAKANVTQEQVDAYLKELDEMSDDDYNRIADNLGLGPAHYKIDGKKPWERDVNRFVGMGTDEDFKDFPSGGAPTGDLGPGGPDAEMVFNEEMDAIRARIAAAKSACEAQGGTFGSDGKCDLSAKTGSPAGGAGGGEDGADSTGGTVGDQITNIFGGLITTHQGSVITERMAELGTNDLSQFIRDNFASITTPDYAEDILQRFGEMRTAVGDAAKVRSDFLEKSVGRAETRIGDIKEELTGELGRFEIGRKEQQDALNNRVINRSRALESSLATRLDDIRAELGEQVTDEFESMAGLVETMTASQASSSREAMTRLGQIADMAAAARTAAPAQLSAEALAGLSDLEFQIENQIAQSEADMKAQINMDQAQALLNETMRRGSFDTQKQQQLVEALLGEKLRGTVYEDRVQEMLTQALLEEDQYVRRFNEDVDRAEANAQLQNLFGTQDYQRQLDMMMLQRGWQTADTLQARRWETTDMTTARGWQVADMEKQREWDLLDALAENAVGDDPLSKVKHMYPDIDESLIISANQISRMSTYREQTSYWSEVDPREENPNFEGNVTMPTAGPGLEGPMGAPEGKPYYVTEFLSQSPAEAYMRVLGEGKVVGTDRDGNPVMSRHLSAEDYATLRALVDQFKMLQAREDAAAVLAQ